MSGINVMNVRGILRGGDGVVWSVMRKKIIVLLSAWRGRGRGDVDMSFGRWRLGILWVVVVLLLNKVVGEVR